MVQYVHQQDETAKKRPAATAPKPPTMKKPAEATLDLPKGLGKGWKVEVTTRGSGESAGKVDRYFVSPWGKKYRSVGDALGAKTPVV